MDQTKIYTAVLVVVLVVKSIGGERCVKNAVVDVDHCTLGTNIQPIAWETKDLCNNYNNKLNSSSNADVKCKVSCGIGYRLSIFDQQLFA